MGYIQTKISNPFIIIPSNKMKGYNLQQTRCTSSSLSHIITSIILQYYNTLQYNTQLYYNAFLL